MSRRPTLPLLRPCSLGANPLRHLLHKLPRLLGGCRKLHLLRRLCRKLHLRPQCLRLLRRLLPLLPLPQLRPLLPQGSLLSVPRVDADVRLKTRLPLLHLLRRLLLHLLPQPL